MLPCRVMLRMSHRVALLLSMLLVGCSAPLRAVLPGTAQDMLRSGLPVAPRAPPPPTRLQGIAGESLGNGLPRAVLRLLPKGATTAAEAATGPPRARPSWRAARWWRLVAAWSWSV